VGQKLVVDGCVAVPVVEIRMTRERRKLIAYLRTTNSECLS